MTHFVTIKKASMALLLGASLLTSPLKAMEPLDSNQNQVLKKDDQFNIFSLRTEDNPNASAFYAKNIGYNPNEFRLLSLDGGGIRGLLEIIELCVLEKIMNDPTNAGIRGNILSKNFGVNIGNWDNIENITQTSEIIHRTAFDKYKDGSKADRLKDDFLRRCQTAKNNNNIMPVYIRDFFDAAAGTSTGSILSAGLFADVINHINGENLTTIDIAKLYYRYGPEVFNKHKTIGSNVISNLYANDGLKGMLNIYFGDKKITDVHKPIFIAACDTTNETLTLFSSLETTPSLKGIKLVDATLSSASAPTFFPAHEFKITPNGQNFIFCDGGVKKNNPSDAALTQIKMQIDSPSYSCISLGTGNTHYQKDTPKLSKNGGLLTVVADITPFMMEMDLKAECQTLIDKTRTKSDLLSTYIRLNPKLKPGLDLLDCTESDYITYMTQTALEETKSPVFKLLCENLGLKMPTDLKALHRSIIISLNQFTFKENKPLWNNLSNMDKDYIFRKISEDDFDFYEDLKLGMVNSFEPFLNSFIDHMKKEYADRGNIGKTLDFMHSLVYEYNPIQKLKRGAAFHNLTNDTQKLKPLTTENLDSLKDLQVEPIYTDENKISWMPGYTRLSYTTEYAATNNRGQDLEFACNIYKNFIALLEELQKIQPKIDGEYANYSQSSKLTGNYVDFLATIYIKDLLRDIQYTASKEQLENLCKALTGPVATVAQQKNWTWWSRSKILAEALRKYIDRKFPHQ